jgi:hypothetical protein
MPDAEPDAPTQAVQRIRTRREESGYETAKPRKESATSTMGGTRQMALGAALRRDGYIDRVLLSGGALSTRSVGDSAEPPASRGAQAADRAGSGE